MTACAAFLLCLPVLADDATARAQLTGAWQQQDDSGKGTSVWVLEAKGDSLHITHVQGDQKVPEFECKPTGAECEGMTSGKKAKVTMYFNGSALVQIETAGSDVTKRQFTVTEQPDMLELKVTPIVGDAKPETLHMKRIQTPTPNH